MIHPTNAKYLSDAYRQELERQAAHARLARAVQAKADGETVTSALAALTRLLRPPAARPVIAPPPLLKKPRRASAI
jgi:hypothetical protein